MPSQLGSGALVVVWFDLHGTDSFPVDNSSVAFASSPGPSTPIEVRHYGSIAFAAGTTPVTITADNTYIATPIDRMSCIAASPSAQVAAAGRNGTVLEITPDYPSQRS